MKKTHSMLELSDVRQLRRYSSGKVSLDGSSRSSLPSISETESLTCSNGTGSTPHTTSTNRYLQMDGSMNRGIRGRSSRPIIFVEEPDDDDNDFFLGSIDVAQEPTPEDSLGPTVGPYKISHTQYPMPPNGEESDNQASQGPSLRYKSDLSASMPVILPSNSSISDENGASTSSTTAPPASSSLRRAASVSCFRRRNSNEEGTATRPKRSISFSNLEIREYDLTIGDNPSVSYGPPVQLSWQYSQGPTRDLEDYESQKMMDRSRGRRSRRVENMSRAKREALLKRHGFTQDDIEAKVKEVNKVKQGRSVTRALVVTGRTEEALESAGRKLKRFFGSNSQSQQPKGRCAIFPHRPSIKEHQF